VVGRRGRIAEKRSPCGALAPFDYPTSRHPGHQVRDGQNYGLDCEARMT
jgi:hypothetical protein